MPLIYSDFYFPARWSGDELMSLSDPNVLVMFCSSNVGTETGAGLFCFVLFVSTDTVLDSGDAQLGQSCLFRRLGPATSDTHTFDFTLPPLKAGPHHVIAIANGARLFPEFNFENNEIVLNGTLTVDVVVIEPTPTYVVLQPGNRTVVRAIAAGGVGLTVNVSSNLTSADAFNKVCVKSMTMSRTCHGRGSNVFCGRVWLCMCVCHVPMQGFDAWGSFWVGKAVHVSHFHCF
jgi:hypothetical protein